MQARCLEYNLLNNKEIVDYCLFGREGLDKGYGNIINPKDRPEGTIYTKGWAKEWKISSHPSSNIIKSY
jgi:hypothetical protein